MIDADTLKTAIAEFEAAAEERRAERAAALAAAREVEERDELRARVVELEARVRVLLTVAESLCSVAENLHRRVSDLEGKP